MLFGVFNSAGFCVLVDSAHNVAVRLGVHAQDSRDILSIKPESALRFLQVSANFYAALHNIPDLTVVCITDSDIAESALACGTDGFSSESLRVLAGIPNFVSFKVLHGEDTMELDFVDGVADALAYTSEKFAKFLREWDGNHAYQKYVNEKDEFLLPSQLSDESREDAVIRLGNTVVEAFQSLITQFSDTKLRVESTDKNGVFSMSISSEDVEKVL